MQVLIIRWIQKVGGGMLACMATKPHTINLMTPTPLFKGWVDLIIS
jgi:hypothetical protein